METRAVVVNAFKWMGLVCFLIFIFHKVTTQDDQEQISYEQERLYDLSRHQQTYLEQRPDTLNFDRFLNEAEIRHVNAIVAFIRLARTISGPRPYEPAETYREFDQRVQHRLSEQSELLTSQVTFRSELAAEKRKEGWLILSFAIGFYLLHRGLDFFWKKPRQGDSAV